MEDFKALIRDTLPIKNPAGTWHLGRNMLLDKDLKSITNENGMEFQHLVSGTVIGTIVAISDIVYFSKNADGTDEIGRVTLNTETLVYETIIKSALFNFQYNCPIEGIFFYNFKKELVVSWSDGVKVNSNRPFVVNLNAPPIVLNVDKTLTTPTEFTKLYMFPDIKEATITTEYTVGQSLDAEVMYMTYAYAFSATDTLSYFSVSNAAYLTNYPKTFSLTRATQTFTPTFRLTDLDTNYSRVRIGFILRKADGTLQGYEGQTISYTGTSIDVAINSLEPYTPVDASLFVISNSIFEKFSTITKQVSQVLIGNSQLKEPFQFQKYANLLALKPFKEEETTTTPFTTKDLSLMPDEVYSFYIELQLPDGSYTDAYHIPGDVATGTELDVLTSTQISTFDLGWTTSITPAVRQFQIINTGVVNADASITTNNTFGHWSNTEVYPNEDDFNSSVDYEGNVITGGLDNRNQPIRYHRVPSKDALDNYVFGDPSLTTTPFNSNIIVGVMLTNFQTVVPPAIRNQIQGYRLSFVKRNNNNNIVLGNWALCRRTFLSINDTDFNFTDLLPDSSNSADNPALDGDFSGLNAYGAELFRLQPSITPTYMKANFLINTFASLDRYTPIRDGDKIVKLKDPLNYVPHNNSVAGTQYREPFVQIFTDRTGTYLPIVDGALVLGPPSTLAYTANHSRAAIDSTVFAYKINVYSGFRSNNLVIIGKTTSLIDNVQFKGGDVSTNNELRIHVNSVFTNTTTNTHTQITLPIRINSLYSPLNGIFVTNTKAITSQIVIPPTTSPAPALDTLVNYNFPITFEGLQNAFVNDITTILTDTFLEDSITNFPNRVNKGVKLNNESITTRSFRTFLVNDYYEMPNDKGEIIALRSTDRKLFIQHRFALFVAIVKDKLQTQNVDAFLGFSDLFERPPEEVYADDKGFIGSTSKFACTIIKSVYIAVNQVTGQIFTLKEGIKEITASGNKNWFWNNWDIGLDYFELDSNGDKQRIDNPFISVGHIIGYDKEYDRLLFTKKMYRFKLPELLSDTIPLAQRVVFDGEFYRLNGEFLDFNDNTYFENQSKTLSYSLSKEDWLFEHDYFPNIIFHTNSRLYSMTNRLTGTNRANLYEHNNKLVKGLFYGVKFESSIDLIFNGNLDITKLYQSIMWVTTVTNLQGGVENFKTISNIMIYNENQCSGVIDINTEGLNVVKGRNNEWNFNNFRDLVMDATLPIIDDNGGLVSANINNNKIWFDKSNFISKFITVRLIVNNQDNSNVAIHRVNVKSVINK